MGTAEETPMTNEELAKRAEEHMGMLRWCHRPEFLAAYQNRVYEIGKLQQRAHGEDEAGERLTSEG